MLNRYVKRRDVLKILGLGGVLAVPGIAAMPEEASAVTPIGPIYAENEGILPSNSAVTNTSAINAAATKARTQNRKLVFGPGTIYANPTLNFDDVIVEGQGQSSTWLKCATNSGGPFISMGNTSGWRWKPQLRDIAIEGPGSYGVGTHPTLVDGVYVPHPVEMIDVRIRYFSSGVKVASNEGHCSWHRCNIQNNYFGIYFAAGGASHGDYFITDCDVGGNNFANIAVCESENLDGLHTLRVHCNNAPYGFYQESGSTAANFMHDCTIENTRFEAIGNAAIFSEKWSQANAGGLTGCRILDSYHSWDSTYRIATLPWDYAVKVGACTVGNQYIAGPVAFAAGTVGAIYIHTNSGAIRADLSSARSVTPACDITINSGYKEGVKYIPPDVASFQGSNTISANSTTRTITTTYAGPVESMRPLVFWRSTGGIANPSLGISVKTSDPATNKSTFTVKAASQPTSTLDFDWTLA